MRDSLDRMRQRGCPLGGPFRRSLRDINPGAALGALHRLAGQALPGRVPLPTPAGDFDLHPCSYAAGTLRPLSTASATASTAPAAAPTTTATATTAPATAEKEPATAPAATAAPDDRNEKK